MRSGESGRGRIGLRAMAEEYRRAADDCFDEDRYLRAFLDDGTPMGKKGDQAWRAGRHRPKLRGVLRLPREHTEIALNTAADVLVDRENGVVKLFDPPFSRTDPRVGYITAYPAAYGKTAASIPTARYGWLWPCWNPAG